MAEQIVIVQQPASSPKDPSAITFGMLKRTHKEYDAAKIAKMRLLHEGGWKILDNARSLIPKAPDEPSDLYNWRIEVTSYVNLLALVTGYLVGALFRAPLVVKPPANPDGTTPEPPDKEFYEAFALDCDEERTNFSQFVRRTTSKGLIYGRAVVGVDMPPSPAAQTRGEEEAQGGGESYLYEVEPEEIVDWKYVKTGRRARQNDGKRRISVRGFSWVKLRRIHEEQETPFSAPTTRPEFKVWTLVVPENGDGTERAAFAVFRTRRTIEEMRGEEFPDDEPMDLVERGVTSYERIPLLCFEPPSDICIGEQAGPLCLEHFRRRSDLAGAMCRSLVEIPFVAQGPEIPEVHGSVAAAAENPYRGVDPVRQARAKNYVLLGPDDKIGFAGPSGTAFNLSAQQLVELEETINRVTVTMALRLENSAAAVGRSGESKKEDKSATEVILDFLSQEVREFAAEIYETVSQGRRDPETKWVASGCDSFDQEDTGAVVDQTVLLAAMSIPSPTARRKIFERMLFKLFPDMIEVDRKAISSELEAGMDTEHLVRQAKQGAEFRVASATTGEPEPSVPKGPA